MQVKDTIKTEKMGKESHFVRKKMLAHMSILKSIDILSMLWIQC